MFDLLEVHMVVVITDGFLTVPTEVGDDSLRASVPPHHRGHEVMVAVRGEPPVDGITGCIRVMNPDPKASITDNFGHHVAGHGLTS